MEDINDLFAGLAGIAAVVFFLITAYLDLRDRPTGLLLVRGIAAAIVGIAGLLALLS